METYTKEWYQQYADENGYELSEKFDKVFEAVKKCDSYCPCRYILWKKQQPENLELIKCPCSMIKEDMQKLGRCHCFLLVKKNNGN